MMDTSNEMSRSSDPATGCTSMQATSVLFWKETNKRICLSPISVRRKPHKTDTHGNWEKIQTQETQTYGMRFTYTETISFFLTWSLRDCPGPVRDTPNPDTETGHPACEKKSKQSSFLVKQGCSLTNQYGISTLTFDGKRWTRLSKNSE